MTFVMSGVPLTSSQQALVTTTNSYPTLCDPMDYSTPGFPVLHHPQELAQSQVHMRSIPLDPYNYVCTNVLSWLWQFHTEYTRL